VAECDHAELVGVFVHPRAGDAEVSRELAGVHEICGCLGSLVAGVVVA
jgi:hypothetical protein